MSCPNCFSGKLKDGKPTGVVTKVHGLPTYIARPQGPLKGVVVIIPDAFGWELVNNRLMADAIAKTGGYLVYLPDFMNGKAASTGTMYAMEGLFGPSPSIATTIFKKPIWFFTVAINFPLFMVQNRESVVWPRIVSFFQAIRTDPDTTNLKFGAAGFCWGGKYTFKLCHDDPNIRIKGLSADAPEALIEAGYTAHPSSLETPGDMEKVKIPISVAVGDVDMAWSLSEIKKGEAALEKNPTPTELVILPGAKHGFGVRADPEDKVQIECAEKGFDQSIAWFQKYLG